MDVFSVKKVFLGGAAVAAVMLLVTSAAWACSPYGDRKVNVQGGAPIEVGPPGTPLVIEGSGYEVEYGPVTIQWTRGGDWGETVFTPELRYVETVERPGQRTGETTRHNLHSFTAQFNVPLDKKDGFLFVIQPYSIRKSLVFTIQPSQIDTGSGGTTTTQPATPPVTPLPTVTTLKVTPSPTRALPPGSQTGPALGADATDGQRPGAPGAPGLPVAGGGAAASDADSPLARAAAQTQVGPQLPPWIDPSERDMQTLWSGLGSSDASTAATLTAPMQPPDDPSRLGAALLTVGALMLLAGGLVAVPRRRALGRIR